MIPSRVLMVSKVQQLEVATLGQSSMDLIIMERRTTREELNSRNQLSIFWEADNDDENGRGR
jgi:hypothetical protein